ncbi:hypothetical protein RSSL_02237 [Streptococcus salivarius K12]|uniref:Uncharacterized protein n=1 Tax=Streptococcus salivarius K12 TaxID=1200793 RepID=J7TVN2_STRSL|nr:hypothetical protein RSSL_02237 [Streptococcus salivarius K12]
MISKSLITTRFSDFLAQDFKKDSKIPLAFELHPKS